MSKSGLRLNSQASAGAIKLEGHELSDKLKILEFKLNDHEQKFKLLLNSGRRSIGGHMGPKSSGPSGSRILSKQGSEDKIQPASA